MPVLLPHEAVSYTHLDVYKRQGNFQRLLADYPADTLHETIPDFHNTVKRFANFKKAVEEEMCIRDRVYGMQVELMRL